MPTKTAIKIGKKSENLGRYAGEWVAFSGRKVIAHSDTLQGLMTEIDARGLRKKVSVFLVPRKDEGPYILVA